MELLKKLKNKNFSSYQAILIFSIGIVSGQIFTIFDFIAVNEQYAVLQAIYRSLLMFLVIIMIIVSVWWVNRK